MTRKEFEDVVLDRYNVVADYPFEEDFETAVFRHQSNGKWFAIAMNISEKKLGKDTDKQTIVVNFKSNPEIIESFVENEVGVYPAYHMNKKHWLTVALSECDDATIFWLLSISYDLTKAKIKNRGKKNA